VAEKADKQTRASKKAAAEAAVAGTGTPEAKLFERLRQLRKRIADEQGVPPYVVFTDTTLQEMAREQPTSRIAMLSVSGVGMKKFETYGEAFIEAILQHSPSKRVPDETDNSLDVPPFSEDEYVPAPRSSAPKAADRDVNGTEDTTFQLHRQGLNPEQIAEQRGLVVGTVRAHLERAYAKGLELRIQDFLSDSQLAEIAAARAQLGGAPALRDLFDHLREKYDYFQLRLAGIRAQRGR
jgi:ATP-dependent DNA helicase RecQ